MTDRHVHCSGCGMSLPPIEGDFSYWGYPPKCHSCIGISPKGMLHVDISHVDIPLNEKNKGENNREKEPQEVIDKMNLLLKEDDNKGIKKNMVTFLHDITRNVEDKCVHKDKDVRDVTMNVEDKGIYKDNMSHYNVDNGSDDSDIKEIVKGIIANHELRKVTPQLLEAMVRDRKRKGLTYDKIQEKYNVSQWVCIEYLRDIVPDKGSILVIKELKDNIERRAVEILSKDGFTDIINLNDICKCRDFDIIASKNKEKWLMDIVVGDVKELRRKTISLRMIPKFTCAILYIMADLEGYSIVELKKMIGRK